MSAGSNHQLYSNMMAYGQYLSQSQQHQYQQQQQQLQQAKMGNNMYSLQDSQDNYSQYGIDDYSTNSYINEESVKQSSSSLQLLEHLELSVFKIHPCNNMQSHNHKQCKFYHSQKDRRRGNIQYISDMCEYAEQDAKNCPLGDKCPKAHNKVEQLYSPDKYKTKYCTQFPKNCASCEYGSYCSFAHSENDITIELIHHYEFDDDFFIFYYKTVWCPFNYLPHDRGQCVYAHNWQDYRRKPNQYKYDQVACQNWKPDFFITKYEDGCDNQYNCSKCHGWKELEYHPLNYRTKPCSSGSNCNKGRACPYYHSNTEKRLLPPNIQSKLFRLAPRNRLIQNLYKDSSEMVASQPQQPVHNAQKLNLKAKGRHSDKISRDTQMQLMKTQAMLLKKSHTQDFDQITDMNQYDQSDHNSDNDSVQDQEENWIQKKNPSEKKRISVRKSINLNAQSFNPSQNLYINTQSAQKELFENLSLKEQSHENSPQVQNNPRELVVNYQNDDLVDSMVNTILD